MAPHPLGPFDEGPLEGWDLRFRPLHSMEGLRRYFAWAGFRAPDLILHVIETDAQLRGIVRAFLVDFANISFPSHRPERPHRYERIQVRSDLFRQVLRHGLSWTELSGPQAHAFRDPDVLNVDLWSHFRDRLPVAPLPFGEAANDQDRTPAPLLITARQGR
jgi:CMP-N-acetylneuraminate monooxygenase